MGSNAASLVFHPCGAAVPEVKKENPAMKVLKFGSFVLIFAAIAAGGPGAVAACTVASVTGVYGITSVGLDSSGQPASSVDQITADGKGKITGSSTKSTNGVIVTSTFTGKYTVAANCTGSVTFTNEDGTIEHDKFVLDDASQGAFMIQTDNNTTQSKVAVAQGTATCTDLGVKNTYAVEATGTVVGNGQAAYVGQLVLNGTGKLTGTITISQDGSIASGVALTGTYEINSNCTGSAVITPKGLPAMHANLLVVNGGKELMVIETDATTIITGLFQM
jgi:hypothetical protein